MAQIDLNQLASVGGLRITSEHEIERQSRIKREEAEAESRIRREEAEAKAERHKDMVRFYGILIGSVIIFAVCGYTLFWDATASPDAKQWAMGVLTALVAAPGGYLVGKTK